MKTMRCELVSWSQVEHLCRQLAVRVKTSGYRPDVVVAIARGGYLPGRMMCDYLDLMALTSIKVEHYLSGSSKQNRAVMRFPLCVDIQGLDVLVVDDVNDSGDTLRLAVEHLRSFNPAQLRVAVMHDKAVSDFAVDYYARKVVKWRWLIYPWAVKEDVSDFLQRLSPQPDSVKQAQQRLKATFDLDISLKQLNNVCLLMDSPLTHKLER